MKGGVLGIVGGGQLGMMTARAAKKLGVKPVVFAMKKNAPAERHAKVTYGDGYKVAEVQKWARQCDAITFEFEHIETPILDALDKCGVPLRPNVNAIKVAQDRIKEKEFCRENKIPIADWILLVDESLKLSDSNSQSEFEKKAFLLVEKLRTLDEGLEPIEQVQQEFKDFFPLIVKTSRWGYDGLGQMIVQKAEQWQQVHDTMKPPLVVEERIDFKAECSMIGARGITGEKIFYPLTQNIHDQGILIRSFAPMAASQSLTRQAQVIVSRMMEALSFVGILAVEFFLLRDDTLLVNEFAPRPHNSGHWTLDGAMPDQFTQLVRVAMGESPQAVRQTAAVEMVNILGKETVPPPQSDTIKNKKTYFYGKEVLVSRPRRKLGHVNYVVEASAEP